VTRPTLLVLLPTVLACSAEPETAPAPAPAPVKPAGPAAPARISPMIAALSAPNWWLPPPDPSNRYADDAKAAALGQRLFFDTSFSGPLLDEDNDGTAGSLGFRGETGKIACASCHVPAAGFLDNRTHGKQISLAAGWGTRRAPSLLGVGHARLLMWDGRHDAAYNQVFGPIETSFEFNSSRLFAAEQMFRLHRAEYEAIFGPMPPLGDASRFPQLAPEKAGCDAVSDKAVCHGVPGDRAEFDGMSAADQTAVTRVVVNMGKAIAAYERLLSCGPGRFDAWVGGDDKALTQQEKDGAALFVGKGGCAKCHAGPLLTDQGFHNIGLAPQPVAYGFVDADDAGAFEGVRSALGNPLNVKGAYSDRNDGRLPDAVADDMIGAFRTPSLRCVSMRPSFMHTGQLRTLEGAVSFFNSGGDASGFRGKSVNTPRSLSDDEQKALVAFLTTLQGPGPKKDLLEKP
jgi:cytochrome c peroxidase